MAMLPRLKPACFYDLVIEVAIVRPGPIQGNMVHPYLQRRRGLEPVEYPSADLRRVLERTLGVPIFQEQVMQIAMVAAGFSGSEADVLRRSMAAWARRGGLEHMHRRLVDGMLERGYTREFAERIFDQIKGFGEYGFPESHAASFALLVYISCWMKCHHPAAFTCALLNSQPMGFYQPGQLVQDARRHGVRVLPADVRYSDWHCTLEPENPAQDNPAADAEIFLPGKAQGESGPGVTSSVMTGEEIPATRPGRKRACQLRLGLRMVKGLGRAAAERVVAARKQGEFHDLQDLGERARLNRRELALLAEAAALRGVAGHRHRARWEAAAVEKPANDPLPGIVAGAEPARTSAIRPPSALDNLRADYASTGLTLGRHPLAFIRRQLRSRRVVPAKDLAGLPHGARVRACGLVTMRQRPMTAKGTIFLTLEDETGFVNAVLWPRLWKRQRAIVLAAALIAIDGVLESDGDVCHLIAERVHDFSELAAGLDTRSRDFC
jgi:error-prone DNA polymerase